METCKTCLHYGIISQNFAVFGCKLKKLVFGLKGDGEDEKRGIVKMPERCNKHELL